MLLSQGGLFRVDFKTLLQGGGSARDIFRGSSIVFETVRVEYSLGTVLHRFLI